MLGETKTSGLFTLRPLTGVRFKSLYSFKGPSYYDGADPYAGLIAVNGTLYGTTSRGGAYYHTCPNGNSRYLTCGTVFKISTTGKETVLYSFVGHKTDGMNPQSALTNLNGILYGTTPLGGAGCPSRGCGVVFAVTTTGKERVLHSFKGGTDGAEPVASLIAVDSVLYGTTQLGGSGSCKYGGRKGCGTVFAVTTAGKEHVVYRFKGGSDGAFPGAKLILLNGTLYGTTLSGGTNDLGTVFAITPSGRETVLHSFGGGSGDGAYPVAGLVNVNGTLYGTTRGGGANCSASGGCGTVFKITPSGKETVVYGFKRDPKDGENPEAALIDVNGTLYGTTEEGGGNGVGTVFSITPSGTETVLHSFKGQDGYHPLAPLVSLSGTLYGTTEIGGSGSGCESTANGCGTVFDLSL
jgi:uncharacterized repeat protein (TIGR03803 family)